MMGPPPSAPAHGEHHRALRGANAADLWWLVARYEDVLEARLRGTARPWRQPAALDPERRAARDEAARVERLERSALAIGEHPAPLHEDTLDLLVDITATADQLADLVSDAAGVDRLASASSAYADPTPYLRHAATHLHVASMSSEQVGRFVEIEAGRLRSEVAVALGEVTDGQTLQAPCPWCRGVTPSHPSGGAYTLRVRTLPGGEVAIVCHGECEPPSEDVGTWWRGKPAWPLATEGEWLADRIARVAS